MTNEVPDFEKISDDIRVWFMKTKGIGYNEFMERIKSELKSAYLAGRKAQVKVVCNFIKSTVVEEEGLLVCTQTPYEIAKAIESQVIE
jgi:hypothetical protein